MLSTSACQLASMTLCDTPTVLQRSCSSPDSMRTRTTRPGALVAAQDAHLVVVQPHGLDLGVELDQRLAQRGVERVHGAVALGGGVLGLAVRALEHDRRLGDRRLRLVALLVDDAEADEPEEAAAVALERLPHEELEGRVGALVGIAARLELLQLGEQRGARPAGRSPGRCRTAPPSPAGWSGPPGRRPARAARCRPPPGRCARTSRRSSAPPRHAGRPCGRTRSARRTPGACWARGWRARRPGARPPPAAPAAPGSRMPSRASAGGWR